MRLITSRSTVSGDAPGRHRHQQHRLLDVESGSRAAWSAPARPEAISASSTTTVATGRRMLKSDEHGALPRCRRLGGGRPKPPPTLRSQTRPRHTLSRLAVDQAGRQPPPDRSPSDRPTTTARRRCAGRARPPSPGTRCTPVAQAPDEPRRRRRAPAAVGQHQHLLAAGADATFGEQPGHLRRGIQGRSRPAPAPGAWTHWPRASMRCTRPQSRRREPLTLNTTTCPTFTSPSRSADTRPSKRMVRGSITFSSSLPTCAVSPATLRSLTTPSKGAHQRCSSVAGVPTPRASVQPPCRSARCCGAVPRPRARRWRSCPVPQHLLLLHHALQPAPPSSAARTASWAGPRLSRMAVSSATHFSTSPALTGSPLSFSTFSTRRPARRAGRRALLLAAAEPVMTGPPATVAGLTVEQVVCRPATGWAASQPPRKPGAGRGSRRGARKRAPWPAGRSPAQKPTGQPAWPGPAGHARRQQNGNLACSTGDRSPAARVGNARGLTAAPDGRRDHGRNVPVAG